MFNTEHVTHSFEVAKHISEDSYGLIFGINTFFALALQSILTAIVVNGNLQLSLRSQVRILNVYKVA